MSVFPEVALIAARLDIREFVPGDVGLVEEAQRLGEPEALPPGAPSEPAGVAAWLADGVHRPRRAGDGVHLMMLDRAAGRIVALGNRFVSTRAREPFRFHPRPGTVSFPPKGAIGWTLCHPKVPLGGIGEWRIGEWRSGAECVSLRTG
jgi:hypothetical protein